MLAVPSAEAVGDLVYMSGRLQGKVAIITGSASGFGKATALMFGREGAHVLLADLDRAGGQSVVEQLTADGAEAELVVGDVSAMETAAALVKRATERWDN